MRISELRSAVKLGWGTLQHHLQLLERAGLVQRVPMGRSAFLVPSGLSERDQFQIVVLSHDASRRIAEAVLEKPGILQKELCRMLHLTRKTFGTHIKMLKLAGLVSNPPGDKRRFEPTPDLLARGIPQRGPSPSETHQDERQLPYRPQDSC